MLNKEAFIEYVSGKGHSDVRFDMYALEIEEYEWINEFVPNHDVIVYSAGGMFPFQAQGLIDGFNFYYREEDGYCELSILNSADDYLSCLYSWRIYHDSIDYLGGKQWINGFLSCLENLKKSDFCFLFKTTGKVSFKDRKNPMTAFIDYNRKGINRDTYPFRAMNINEAKNKIFNRDSSLVSNLSREIKSLVPYVVHEHEWTDEEKDYVLSLFKQIIIIDSADDQDNRVFPDVDLVFTVSVPESCRDENGFILLDMLENDDS